MSLDGRDIQDRLTKRGDKMDQGSRGIMMEVYTQGNGIMTRGQKEGNMSCKQMELTHSSKSNMIIMECMRLRKRK